MSRDGARRETREKISGSGSGMCNRRRSKGGEVVVVESLTQWLGPTDGATIGGNGEEEKEKKGKEVEEILGKYRGDKEI